MPRATQGNRDGMATPADCPRCGAPVSCGHAQGAARCWCYTAPHLPREQLGEYDRCLCPACLSAAQAAAIRNGR
ncbi:cysteine-rich CWC family protein [Pandoraea sp.]|uniref:cysteine-rich CWC family protein n=1 Tax=Pandoraea sp. TaxID=1883445 RepID=UPI0025F05AE8|nr:cysteine-rich CWC family protein [Pandoraea sp.]